MPEKNSHCSYCGAAFADAQPWPRTCTTCKETSFTNPLPVAVVLVPVGAGLLAVRRAIPPGRGQLALPGGYCSSHEIESTILDCRKRSNRQDARTARI